MHRAASGQHTYSKQQMLAFDRSVLQLNLSNLQQPSQTNSKQQILKNIQQQVENRRPSRNPISDQVSSQGWHGASGEVHQKTITPLNSEMMKTHELMEVNSEPGVTNTDIAAVGE